MNNGRFSKHREASIFLSEFFHWPRPPISSAITTSKNASTASRPKTYTVSFPQPRCPSAFSTASRRFGSAPSSAPCSRRKTVCPCASGLVTFHAIYSSRCQCSKIRTHSSFRRDLCSDFLFMFQRTANRLDFHVQKSPADPPAVLPFTIQFSPDPRRLRRACAPIEALFRPSRR